MNMMRVTDVEELLNILHDRLRFVLEDPEGKVFHEDDFEATFASAIQSLGWR